MVDTITTTPTLTGIEDGPLTLPGTPAVTDRRGNYAGELARAEAALAEAQARIAEHAQTIERLRTEQIKDGSDPRLVFFWDKAGRIADHAEFCDEYDRMAEAMNGTRRERDWSVAVDVTVTVRVDYSTTATSQEDAEDNAREGIDFDAVIEAYQNNGSEGFETRVVSSERE